MAEAVIFDIDGMLVDSVDLHASAWVDAFRHFGHQVLFEEARRRIGKGGDQLLPVFLSKQEISNIGDDLEKHRGQIFKEHYLSACHGLPSGPRIDAALTG